MFYSSGIVIVVVGRYLAAGYFEPRVGLGSGTYVSHERFEVRTPGFLNLVRSKPSLSEPYSSVLLGALEQKVTNFGVQTSNCSGTGSPGTGVPAEPQLGQRG